MSKKYDLFLRKLKKLGHSYNNKMQFLEIVLNLVLLKKLSDLDWLQRVLENNQVNELFDFRKIRDSLPPDLFAEMIDIIAQYDFSKLSDFEFADFHNGLVDDEVQKERGQVFTKQWIVDYIIDRLEIDSEQKILEPSVGFGNFVSGIIRKLDSINLDNLTFYDIDPLSLKFTNLMLQMKSIEKNWNSFGTPDYRLANLLQQEDEEVYDVVIGNPPYINIYNIPDDEKAFYSDNFYSSFKKYDIYMLFIEKGLRMLKPGGKLGFIISDKILNQPNGERIRKYILEHSKILEITDLTNIKVFEGKTVSNVLIFLEKNEDALSRDEHLIKIRKLSIDQDDKAQVESEVLKRQGELFKNGFEFNIDIDESRELLLRKIEDKTVKLGDFCYVNWGTRSVPAKEFHLANPRDGESRRLIKGENIHKFNISYSGKWLDYKPEKLYNPLFPEMFEAPKLIFCEVTGKEGIIAAFDDQGYFTDHSLSVCVPVHHFCGMDEKHRFFKKIDFSGVPISSRLPLEYLSAVVNSKLMFFYFSTKLSSKLNVYPNHVKALPIKLASELMVEKISQLSSRLSSNLGQISRHENQRMYFLESEQIPCSSVQGKKLFVIQSMKDIAVSKSQKISVSNNAVNIGSMLRLETTRDLPDAFWKLLVEDALESFLRNSDLESMDAESFARFLFDAVFPVPDRKDDVLKGLSAAEKKCQSLGLKCQDIYNKLNKDIFEIYELSAHDIRMIEEFYNSFEDNRRTKLKHFTL